MLEQRETAAHAPQEFLNTGFEPRNCRAKDQVEHPFAELIGDSPQMMRVKKLAARIAASSTSTVLLTGESGNGKDLLARAIHCASARAKGPFINITCSALPDALLESELFGHERGAFTDAHQQKRGLLEQAQGGTVFLDEIGDTPPPLQAKLLRFLEEHAFRRVGGTAELHPNVRVISATNKDLRLAVQGGLFRDDLYYRLAVAALDLPPLRERVGDIPRLVAHFIALFNREQGRNVTGLHLDALALLCSYWWPGNVRELRNAVERAMLFSDEPVLRAEDFSLVSATGGARPQFELPPEGLDLKELERSLVEQALERAGGNHTRAAALLGLNRDQIRYRVGKYGLRG